MWVCPLTASIDWFFSLEPGTLFSYPRYYLTHLEEIISNRFSLLLDNKETLTKAQQFQALKTFYLSPSLLQNIGKGIELNFIHLFYRPKHWVPFHIFSSRPRYCILTVAWWGSFSPLTKQQRHLSQYGISFFHRNTLDSFNYWSKLHAIHCGTNNKDPNFSSEESSVSLKWQKQLACLWSSIHWLSAAEYFPRLKVWNWMFFLWSINWFLMRLLNIY